MKNVRNNKTSGISLVALIVTIIVLIILTAAVIVTFMEGGIIDRAKESVFKSDIRTYQEILAVKRAEEQIKLATGNGEEELKLIDKTITGEDIVGIIPEFKVKEYGELVEVTNGEIVAKKELDEEVMQEKWLIELGIGTGVVSNKITFTKSSEGDLVVGSELIASNGERFYLMEDSGSTLTLLAKELINTTTYTQESGNHVVFSSTSYWYDSINSTYITYDLNDTSKIPEGVTTPALTAAIAYGEKLGVEGRLMTKAEAESWQDGGELETKLYAAGDYWLGTASEEVYYEVWLVWFNSLEVLAYGNAYGVRPVITISESAVN